MCGRYAASRDPDDLVEEFEVDKVDVPAELGPDFNVAPTKDVYAVLTRPVKDDPDPAAAGAPAAGAALGARAVAGRRTRPSARG